MTNTVSSRLLTPIIMYLNKKKVPLESFFAKAELNVKQDKPIRIPLYKLNKCYSIVQELCNNDSYGLIIGQYSSLAYYGITGQILINSESIEEMFENYFKYHPILCDTLRFLLEKNGSSYKIRLNLNNDFHYNKGFIESLLCAILTNIGFITGKKIEVESVSLMHSPPYNTNDYRNIFGVTPLFNQKENSITFPEYVLKYNILFNDKNILKNYKIEANIELGILTKKNLSEKIRAILYSNHIKGFPTLKELSVIIGMSYRAIQEQLKLEGNTYSKICTNLKLELSKKYLSMGMSVTEVSSLLHFSEPSSFTHFFKRKTSQTPGNFE